MSTLGLLNDKGMTIKEITEKINGRVFCGEERLSEVIEYAFSSDLLSDVIGNAREGNVWITLQAHHNIVAVASLKDISAIVIVRGGVPDDETIKKSNQENIPVLSAEEDTFTVAGKLYNLIGKK